MLGIVAVGLSSGAVGTHKAHFTARASSLSPAPFTQTPVEPAVIEEVRYVRVQPKKPVQAVSVAPAMPLEDFVGGLSGSLGYAKCGGNCVNEPGLNKPKSGGNPITWQATTQTPSIGATALWTYNHTGVVTGIWSNGDIEVRHQNFCGGQHRFPRSAFRGFR